MGARARAARRARNIWGLVRRAWKRRPIFRLGAIITLILVIMGVLGPFIAPYPSQGWGIPPLNSRGAQPPSLQHPFGTDTAGRDLLSRILVGAGMALLQIIIVVAVSLAVGLLVGSIAAYYGGILEKILNYFTETFMAFPAIIIALALNSLFGRGIWIVLVSLIATWWSWYARITYVHARSIKSMEYVLLAELAGLRKIRVLFRHVLPAAATPVLVQAITDTGSVLLEASSINFLGLGLPPDYPDWGVLVQNGFNYTYSYPWISLIPGAFILITALGLSLMGDTLREEMDPRLRRRWRLWF
jgi:peptide/nickel transport system permease protein